MEIKKIIFKKETSNTFVIRAGERKIPAGNGSERPGRLMLDALIHNDEWDKTSKEFKNILLNPQHFIEKKSQDEAELMSSTLKEGLL